MEEFKSHIESIIKDKDVKLAIETTENIMSLMRALVETFRAEGEREKDYINYIDENFARLPWKDATRARRLVNQAKSNINNNGNTAPPPALRLSPEEFAGQLAHARPRHHALARVDRMARSPELSLCAL